VTAGGIDPAWMAALALAAYACRAGGFWLMRFFSVTPRLEAALRAAPLAVMVGVVTPAALHGGLAELGGLASVVLVMRALGNDLVATLTGVVTVALLRMALG
jgi:uncharacterized membrane protein